SAASNSWRRAATCRRRSSASAMMALVRSLGGRRRRRGSRRGQCGFGRMRQLGERRGVARRDLGQRLAVEIDAGELQARDETAVGDVVLPRGRVDADDPQPPIVAFLALAAGGREVAGAIGGFLGELVELALAKEIALGHRKKLLARLSALVPAFDSRHRGTLFGWRGQKQPARRTCSGGDASPGGSTTTRGRPTWAANEGQDSSP